MTPVRTDWRSRSDLLKRFRSLAIGEAVNVILQPLIFLGWLGMPPTPANLIGFGLVLLLLVQGSVYWLSKHRQIKRALPRPPGIELFRVLRWGNVGALAAGFVVIGPALTTTPSTSSWPGLAFWLFAVMEYVNYFHVQLMPAPTQGQWRPRTSHLARDLRQAR